VRIYTRLPGMLVTLGALTAAALALSGFGLVALWSVAVLAGILLLARWMPLALAFAVTVGTFFVLELLLLLVTPLIGIGMTVPHIFSWATVSAAIGILCTVRPALPELSRHDVLLMVAGSASSLILVVCLAIAQAIPGGQRFAWAMNGDTVNAMGFARRMLVDGGIDPASTPQPTPLPFAMSAANMEGARSGAASLLLQHDVSRTAQVWVFVIVVSCLLVGTILARAARTAPVRWAVPVVALASTASLSWHVIGLQFQFGFMNSAFAVALLLAAWLAFTGGTARPAIALFALFAVALALLSVWSPLVVCMAGLVVVTVVHERSLIARSRPVEFVAAALAAGAFLGYAALVTVPGFLQSSGALGNDGGFPALGPGSTLVITSLLLVASALGAQTGAGRSAAGVVSIVAGFGLGLGYLLAQRHDAAFGWGYYPAKFAWTASILLMVILLSFAVHLLRAVEWSPGWRRIMTAGVAALMVSVLWGPVSPGAQVPLAGIVRDGPSEEAAEIVFDLVGSENGKDFLWRSAVGDYWINTWLLQIDRPDTDPLKIYATVLSLAPDQVCALAGGLGSDVVIHTSDPNARADLEAVCPDVQYTLEEGDY